MERGEKNPRCSEREHPSIPIPAAKTLPFLRSTLSSHPGAAQTAWHGDNPRAALPERHLPQCSSWAEASFWGINLNSPFLGTWRLYPSPSRRQFDPPDPTVGFSAGLCPTSCPSLGCPVRDWFAPTVLARHRAGSRSCPTGRLPTRHLPLHQRPRKPRRWKNEIPTQGRWLGRGAAEGPPCPHPSGVPLPPPGHEKGEGNLRKEEARLGQPISQGARFPSGQNPAPRVPPAPGQGSPSDGGGPAGGEALRRRFPPFF